MAQWHGLAKLRLHTDDTLAHLDKLTTTLGDQLRKFKKRTCSAFQTKELPRETLAREMGEINAAAAKAKRRTTQKPHGKKQSENPPAKHSKPSKKEFKLNVFKNHSLGHYVEIIRRYGTTDSYSTESVSDLTSLPETQS